MCLRGYYVPGMTIMMQIIQNGVETNGAMCLLAGARAEAWLPSWEAGKSGFWNVTAATAPAGFTRVIFFGDQPSDVRDRAQGSQMKTEMKLRTGGKPIRIIFDSVGRHWRVWNPGKVLLDVLLEGSRGQWHGPEDSLGEQDELENTAVVQGSDYSCLNWGRGNWIW